MRLRDDNDGWGVRDEGWGDNCQKNMLWVSARYDGSLPYKHQKPYNLSRHVSKLIVIVTIEEDEDDDNPNVLNRFPQNKLLLNTRHSYWDELSGWAWFNAEGKLYLVVVAILPQLPTLQLFPDCQPQSKIYNVLFYNYFFKSSVFSYCNWQDC